MLKVATSGVTLLVTVLATSWPGPSEGSVRTDEVEASSGAPAEDAPVGRAIVRESRRSEVMGHIELEDEDVIVIRDLDGKLHSFAKSRVVQIVRLVEPQPDQPGRVFLKNGQVREGIILSDTFDGVVMMIEGVRVPFKRAHVDRVQLEPTFRERYEHFRSLLRDDAPARHLELCRWLVHERAYELAEQELLDLLERDPMPEARELLTLTQAQLALRRPREATGSDEPGADPASGGEDDDSDADDEPAVMRVTSRDVNIVRVYELDFRRPPQVVVSRDTIGRLIESYSAHDLLPASQSERSRLYKADSLEIVELMFNLQAREMYDEIEVLTEPWALNEFRQRVHNTWLMNNCATSRCHGGPDGGRLYLERRRHKDERVRYANLLTLERLDLGDPEWPLLNYARPSESLIIQYGLPRELARRAHPSVPGWRPAFRRPDDRMVRDTIEWLESMYRPRPEYPVAFDPNRPGAAGGGSDAGSSGRQAR